MLKIKTLWALIRAAVRLEFKVRKGADLTAIVERFEDTIETLEDLHAAHHERAEALHADADQKRERAGALTVEANKAIETAKRLSEIVADHS